MQKTTTFFMFVGEQFGKAEEAIQFYVSLFKNSQILTIARYGPGEQGALCARLSWSGPELSNQLAPQFTEYNYDRRGRGDSGDTKPYAVAREVEDIEALIDEAGGSAYLYGHSSGAALVLEAAIQLGQKIKKLALYDAPYNDEAAAKQAWKEYIKRLTQALAADCRYDTAQALCKAIPDAKLRIIEGQTHAVDVDVLAPVLVEFFSEGR
jgi:pimeloyl-ACP methyl ester carboxylesterase